MVRWNTWTTLFRKTGLYSFLVSRVRTRARARLILSRATAEKPAGSCLSAFVHDLHLSLGSTFTTRGGTRMAEINATPGRVTSSNLRQVVGTLNPCPPRNATSANAGRQCFACRLISGSTTTLSLSRRTSTSVRGWRRNSPSIEDCQYLTSSGVIDGVDVAMTRRVLPNPPPRHKKVAALVRPLLQKLFDRIPVGKLSIRSLNIQLMKLEEGALDGSKDPATAMSIAILYHDLPVAVLGVSTHFRREVTA